MPRRRRGRPSLCTRELTDALMRLVRGGMPLRLAADACGVSSAAVKSWVTRGERRDGGPVPSVYGRFAMQYRKARAMFALACWEPCFRVIIGDIPRDADEERALYDAARVGRWMLERRFPEHWGRHRESPAFVRGLVEAEASARPRSVDDEFARDAVVRIFGGHALPDCSSDGNNSD